MQVKKKGSPSEEAEELSSSPGSTLNFLACLPTAMEEDVCVCVERKFVIF